MKKKLLLYLLLSLFPIGISAQSKQAIVTLKNGTELKGVIKSIDPTDALIIEIAGIEATIKMDNIQRIEENETTSILQTGVKELSQSEKLTITDNAQYPDSFDLNVGDKTIKMILVRGGIMNMGYDGRGSWGMKSEPVHKVGVTSFYISKDFVRSEIVKVVKGKSHKKEFHYESQWKDAYKIAGAIAEKSGLPVRLPTEAEWEYAASSPDQEILFSKCKSFEFCNDIYGEFQKIDPILEPIIDPTGPVKGRYHVIRAYDGRDGKYNRSHYTRQQYLHNNYDECFRIVIKAKDYLKH